VSFGGFEPPVAPEHRDPPPPVAPQGTVLATVALACGVIGLVVLPPLFSTAAIVCGRRAQAALDAAGVRHGRANATAGIVLGWVGLATFAVLLVLLLTGDVRFDGGRLQVG
jgi:hypothetical protein